MYVLHGKSPTYALYHASAPVHQPPLTFAHEQEVLAFLNGYHGHSAAMDSMHQATTACGLFILKTDPGQLSAASARLVQAGTLKVVSIPTGGVGLITERTNELYTHSGKPVPNVQLPRRYADEKRPPPPPRPPVAVKAAPQAIAWIDLDYRYADGTTVIGASYEITTPQGQVLKQGRLTQQHQYVVLPDDAPRQVNVRFYADPPLTPQTLFIQPQPPRGKDNIRPNWWDRMTLKLEKSWQTTQDTALWTWGAVQGDFNENPTTGQIVFNTALTLIPVVDQLGDIRDLTANLKKLLWDEQYDDTWVWIGLVLTLIGCIPVLGSAIKGIAKWLLKAGKNLEVADYLKVFNVFGKGDGIKFLKDLDLDKYAKDTAQTLKTLLNAIEAKLTRLKGLVPASLVTLQQKFTALTTAVGQVRQRVDDKVAQVFADLKERRAALLEKAKGHRFEEPAPINARHEQRQQIDPHYKRMSAQEEVAFIQKQQPKWVKKGKVPEESLGLKKAPVKEGWPDLNSLNEKGNSREDYLNFSHASPVTLTAERKLYRVVDPKSGNAAPYWLLEDPRTMTKGQWRADYGVKRMYNENGEFIEYIPKEGETLKAWQGPAAAQEYDTTDYYLAGGKEQIFLDPTQLDTSRLIRQPTNWKD